MEPAGRGAAHLPAPARGPDDGLADRQPEPRAARLVTRSMEPIEDPVALVFGDTGAGIIHDQPYPTALAGDRHLHRATFWGVLAGIVDQIEQDFGDQLRVSSDL